jgi:heme-degrading monooxygenase HmoA
MTPRKCVTVFRSRLRAGDRSAYTETADRMEELAAAMPGYIGRKVFVAEDGERLSLVEFETLEHARAWGAHPEHRAAQRRGRDEFYDEYSVQTCEVERESVFSRESAERAEAKR